MSNKKEVDQVVKDAVEVQLSVPGVSVEHRKHSRNSWAENDARIKSIQILGQDECVDEWLQWRIKWVERMILCAGLGGAVCLIAASETDDMSLRVAVATCCAFIFIGFCIMVYKNISVAIVKRLLREWNVIIILILTISNVCIEFWRPRLPLSPILTLGWGFVVYIFVLLDAIKIKGRIFVITLGGIFTLPNVYLIYQHTLGSWNKGVVLFSHTIRGEEYSFSKRSTQLTIYMHIFLASVSGIYTLIKDKKMELIMLATGNIYRETGDGVENARFSTRKNNNDNEAGNLLKTTWKARRNTWAEMYHQNVARRRNLKLLGQDVVIDTWLDWRVKWGQRGTGILCLPSIVSYVMSGSSHPGFIVSSIVFGSMMAIFFGILYYKNLSYVVMRRLLHEPNVVFIFILACCICSIDIANPTLPLLSPMLGVLYIIVTQAFIFVDALKSKSRIFLIVIAFVNTILNLYCVYGHTFDDWGKDVVLFNYTIRGEVYPIMKRSTKRSIFLQILLFSMSGLLCLIKDKKLELMVFATRNIYRATGTTDRGRDT